ncbi:MAG: hypothetical protein J6Z22_04085 [Lachnospiraceae bacterium]|nr:hypothetical protein [Lachnospiraceae bacterium]
MYGEENKREITPQIDWAMLDRCKYLGKKMKQILIINLLMLIGQTAISGMAWLANQRMIPFTKITLGALVVCAVVIIVCAIAYCVILVSMGAYYAAFGTSGILMIVATFLSVWEEFNDNAGLALLIALGTAVAEFFQMKLFVNGCEDSLTGIDSGLMASWSSYWRIYVSILVVGIVATFGIIIPIINILAAIAILVVALASLAISIWMLILINRTSNALTRRAVTLEFKGGVAS